MSDEEYWIDVSIYKQDRGFYWIVSIEDEIVYMDHDRPSKELVEHLFYAFSKGLNVENKRIMRMVPIPDFKKDVKYSKEYEKFELKDKE